MSTETRPRIEAHLGTRPESCRFELDRPLYEGPAVVFLSPEEARGSPLAERLFELPDTESVLLSPASVTVTRTTFEDWGPAARRVAEVLWGHLESGRRAVSPEALSRAPSPEELARRVAELLDTEVNPMVAMHGGFIELVEVRDYVAYLRMGGGCQGCGAADFTLRQWVEAAIRERIPQVVGVADITDHASGTHPYYAASPSV